MTTRTLIASTLALSVAAGVGLAAEQSGAQAIYAQRGPVPFEVLDRDGNGVVTADEHGQVHRERYEYRMQHGYPLRNGPTAPSFGSVDRNRDGGVTRDELMDWRDQRMQQRGMGWRAR